MLRVRLTRLIKRLLDLTCFMCVCHVIKGLTYLLTKEKPRSWFTIEITVNFLVVSSAGHQYTTTGPLKSP